MAQVSTFTIDPATPLFDVSLTRTTTCPARRGIILVVEDRDDVRQGVAQLLELHGFVVLDAADGERALHYLASGPDDFALVLLDLLLPGSLSGYGLRAHQLADPQLSRIPTIVVSACEPDVPAQLTLQPDAWLEKPFRFDTLLTLVQRFVTPETGGLVAD